MPNQFIVQIMKRNAQGHSFTIRMDGPFTDPMEANRYGIREANKLMAYHNVLPLSPPIPQG